MYGYSTSMFLINSFIYSSAPPVETEFKMTVDTTQAGSASDTFVLPLQNGATSMTVYWGDGNSDVITTYNQAELTHVYASSGTYQISLDGSFSGIRFAGGGDRLKLSSIDNWGNNQWQEMSYSFYNCSNMVGTYTDNPDTSLVGNMYGAFRACSSFNSDLIFDCSNVTTMGFMFFGCSVFNSDVAFTNTSNVLSMGAMFRTATVFNKPLNFDTSSVTDMSNMLRSTAFDQDISGFNISSLTTASAMFLYNTAFSTTNYDLLLVGWEGQTHNNSVNFHAGTAQYSSGAPATARAGLISDSWTITDGGQV